MTRNLCIFFNPIITLLKKNVYESAANRIAIKPPVDIFSYRSQLRYKLIKTSVLNGCIDNHHIIPQQYKDHDIIKKLNYNINFSYNIKMLANSNFKKHKCFIEFPDILIHAGGHSNYNKYVKRNLDEINCLNEDESKYIFWLFHQHLSKSLDDNCKDIPWN